MHQQTHHKKGFTLIEVLVVIAIIGIFVSVIFASLSSARESARDARRIAQLAQVQRAIESYYAVGGLYLGSAVMSKEVNLANVNAKDSLLTQLLSVNKVQAQAGAGDYCIAFGPDSHGYLESNLSNYIHESAAAPRGGHEVENSNFFYTTLDNNTEYCLGIELENPANVPSNNNPNCLGSDALAFDFEPGYGYAVGNYSGGGAVSWIGGGACFNS
jgi:prepilin-type N-terminal cleavage/methylation domain-containing protein